VVQNFNKALKIGLSNQKRFPFLKSYRYSNVFSSQCSRSKKVAI